MLCPCRARTAPPPAQPCAADTCTHADPLPRAALGIAFYTLLHHLHSEGHNYIKVRLRRPPASRPSALASALLSLCPCPALLMTPLRWPPAQAHPKARGPDPSLVIAMSLAFPVLTVSCSAGNAGQATPAARLACAATQIRPLLPTHKPPCLKPLFLPLAPARRSPAWCSCSRC